MNTLILEEGADLTPYLQHVSKSQAHDATEFLRTTAEQRGVSDAVIVFDRMVAGGKWPSGCKLLTCPEYDRTELFHEQINVKPLADGRMEVSLSRSVLWSVTKGAK